MIFFGKLENVIKTEIAGIYLKCSPTLASTVYLYNLILAALGKLFSKSTTEKLLLPIIVEDVALNIEKNGSQKF